MLLTYFKLIITSAKDGMFYVALVCLSVYICLFLLDME